jgi:hypothetical protein
MSEQYDELMDSDMSRAAAIHGAVATQRDNLSSRKNFRDYLKNGQGSK